MIIVQGIPYRLEEPGSYVHPQFGEIESMWFRVQNPDLPQVAEGKFEETFEANNTVIEEIKAAAKAGAVVRLKVRPVAAISKADRAWVKFVVSEVLE